MRALLPALLAALAVLLWPRPPRAADRLSRVLPRPPAEPAPPPRRAPLPTSPRTVCLLAGAALALVVGGGAGLLLGAVTAVGGPRLLAGLEPAADRAAREQLEADLPTALDLLAACLGGGASVPDAVRAVAGAVPGPAGERFTQVAAALDLGAPAGEAWQRLVPPGRAGDAGLAAAAARSLVRTARSGAPVAASVARLAQQSRAQARGRQEQAAARAGVRAVAPLGLCFLPAFVLLGIVPVVVGLVGPVLATL